MKRLLKSFLSVALMGIVVSLYAADVIVYEGFQYDSENDSLHGQPEDPGATDTDATGLTGTWSDSTGATGNMFLKGGSLVFGDLTTNGRCVGYLDNSNNDIFYRDLLASAKSSVNSASVIWFGVLFEKLQNNFSAGEGGFALANQVVGNSRLFENDGTDGLAGFGFGPTTDGNDLKAYAWDGASNVIGTTEISVPANNGTSDTSGYNIGTVHLLVGRISFDSGTSGKDEYTLYDYQLNGGSVVGGTLSAIGDTLEVDIDQGGTEALDVINITRQVNLNYDEIRVGLTLDSVLGIVPPPAGTVFSVR